jgi:hypothetical protein
MYMPLFRADKSYSELYFGKSTICHCDLSGKTNRDTLFRYTTRADNWTTEENNPRIDKMGTIGDGNNKWVDEIGTIGDGNNPWIDERGTL